jgi:ubiquinone/menaquinone biosynthesis C-methylase UbiE
MPAMSHVESLLCRSAPWRTFATRVVLPWALDGERLDGHVLEVGSGSGAIAAALLDQHANLTLTATDYDPKMVRQLERRLTSYGDRASVAQADATQLPFADDTFDVALSFLMLHHVGNWEAALTELARVVKPGGRVIGCDMLQSGFLDWSERTFGSGDERLIQLDEFQQVAGQIGLKCAERGPLHAFRFAIAV